MWEYVEDWDQWPAWECLKSDDLVPDYAVAGHGFSLVPSFMYLFRDLVFSYLNKNPSLLPPIFDTWGLTYHGGRFFLSGPKEKIITYANPKPLCYPFTKRKASSG